MIQRLHKYTGLTCAHVAVGPSGGVKFELLSVNRVNFGGNTETFECCSFASTTFGYTVQTCEENYVAMTPRLHNRAEWLTDRPEAIRSGLQRCRCTLTVNWTVSQCPYRCDFHNENISSFIHRDDRYIQRRVRAKSRVREFELKNPNGVLHGIIPLPNTVHRL